VHNSPSALSCFAVYNTELRKVFPGRNHVMRNLAGPSLGGVGISFSRSRNNVTGEVYCLRARDRIASAARWSSDVFPYLGPDIIAVMQAAWSFAPNDSQTGPRLPFRNSGDRIIPLIVLLSSPSYSNLRSVALLNVWVRGRP
jgi:hypothetical protein